MGLNQRYSSVLLLIVPLCLSFVISACSMPQEDPTKQTIPTDSAQWQKKLGDTFEQLPEDDRGLLSRYMLRMKLSDAYESGAMPRITIKQALVQQREYERLHLIIQRERKLLLSSTNIRVRSMLGFIL